MPQLSWPPRRILQLRPTPHKMSRCQIKMRLATPLLVNNRPRTCNPARRRSPRNSRRIRRTLAGERDQATPAREARAPGKLLQNRLEPGAALLGHPPRLTRLHLCPRDQRRARRPLRNPGASQPIDLRLKAAFPAAKEKIMHNNKSCYLSNDI